MRHADTDDTLHAGSTLTPEAVLTLARGFQESRVLLTGAELDLFTLLSNEILTADAIAARLGADLRALTIELDALAAMELLVKADGTYRTAPGASRLSAEAPDSIHPMLLHAAGLWDRWTNLTRKIGGTPLSERPPADATRAFIGTMQVVSAPQAARLAADAGIGSARRMLDVGGGPGTYTAAFLRAAPKLEATLFDLPAVVEIARDRLSAAGLLDRVTLVGGDFESDELPVGHDLAWLSAIIHQNGPAQNDALFGRIFRALLPGGRLVIRDHVMGPDRTRPPAGALFAVNMLVGTAQGGTYTFDEIRAGLERAGFVRVRPLREGERMDALVEAFRP
ncbi:MAG: acetylserotonin O-methyltransferase [Thermoanaerobaculia bacterium]|nr:acetylserotonin O-methyltransferase [Thermoanaerobaculia bacterium]